MSSKFIALLSIVVASLLWSSAGVVAKVLLQSFAPFSLAFWRFLVASVCILPIYLIKKEKIHITSFLKDVLPVALLSSINITLFYIGLLRTTVNAASIIYAATPLIVAFLSNRYLGEKLIRQKIWGITIGFLGVLVILVLPLIEKETFSTGDFGGNMIIIAAAISWALYTIGSRKLTRHDAYSPLIVSTASIVVGAFIFLISHLLLEPSSLLPAASFSALNVGLILHLGVMVTVVTYILYQWGIKHSSAVTASLSSYIQPVFSILLASIFLNEHLTFWFIIGSMLVFLGIFLTSGESVGKELYTFVSNKNIQKT